MKRLLCAIIGCFIILSGCSNGKQVSNETEKEDTENYKLSLLFILCISLQNK